MKDDVHIAIEMACGPSRILKIGITNVRSVSSFSLSLSQSIVCHSSTIHIMTMVCVFEMPVKAIIIVGMNRI